ncbi:MAG TPA: type II toxin-antitoxin system RelE/ParE family toxin [Pyrinomonadaceae bacterium]|nr:type II toxin-antitoxin system RelE/ParE family toxin [Pyrinomonadaceae bacterium]
MSYRLLVLSRAEKDLKRLPAEYFERVRDAIRNLASNPRPVGSLKLVGRTGWRIRVGVYRVIYEIDDKQQSVTILNVGHRRDIY